MEWLIRARKPGRRFGTGPTMSMWTTSMTDTTCTTGSIRELPLRSTSRCSRTALPQRVCGPATRSYVVASQSRVIGQRIERLVVRRGRAQAEADGGSAAVAPLVTGAPAPSRSPNHDTSAPTTSSPAHDQHREVERVDRGLVRRGDLGRGRAGARRVERLEGVADGGIGGVDARPASRATRSRSR